jgi:hypothetical protein
VFREEEGVQLVQEMKARFSANILSSRQQASMLASVTAPSTSSSNPKPLVSKVIVLIICITLQYFNYHVLSHSHFFHCFVIRTVGVQLMRIYENNMSWKT